MTVDFYYAAASAPCRSVLMGAKAVGVDLNLKVVDIMAGETRTEDFIKMNIQHTVPTLDDNGFCMSESRAILQYLANKYGKDDKLYPSDPVERAKVDMKLFFDMGTLYARFAEAYYPVFFKQQPLNPELVDKLSEAIGFLEHYLADGYVAGSNLTIADFAVVATLSTIEAIGFDLSKFPRTQAYLEKVKGEIEGYAELNQEGVDQFAGFAKPALAKMNDA